MIKNLMGMMLAAVLALASQAKAYEVRIDGSWFAGGNYGGTGDTVITDVKSQQADYDTAAAAADEDQSNFRSDASSENATKLLTDRKEAARLATFSWVQAEWYLAIADDALSAGDSDLAKAYFQKALDAATKASALTNVSPDSQWLTRAGKDVVAGSHMKGDKDQALAKAGLAKCSK